MHDINANRLGLYVHKIQVQEQNYEKFSGEIIKKHV